MGFEGIFIVGPKVGKITFFWASILALSGALCVPALAEELPEAVSIDEVRRLQVEKAELILWDARDKRSFDDTHIRGAELPLGEDFYKASELYAKGFVPQEPDALLALKERTTTIDRSKLIVTYCNRNCKASEVLATQLLKLGFSGVRWMPEGLESWEEKGYPVTIGVPKLRDS